VRFESKNIFIYLNNALSYSAGVVAVNLKVVGLAPVHIDKVWTATSLFYEHAKKSLKKRSQRKSIFW
jgi:ribonucleotide monophosphatase NagD (HAD superfamily)